MYKKKKKDEDYALVNATQTVQPTTDIRTVDTVNTPQKNLENAENKLNEANKKYEKALSKELKKTGKDYTTKFENPLNKRISFETKKEDQKISKPTPIPVAEANKNLQKELTEQQQALDQWKIANYQNNLDKVQNEKSTLFDKTVGVPIRAVKDLFSPLTTGDDNTIVDEKGNKTFLPSYDELKQQKVREDTKGIGGTLQDVGYNATKILGAGALDLVTGGLGGKSLYWTDMAEDNYKNVKNQGYSNEQAIANTLISTGSEFLTEKLLGGLAGKLTGGEASEVQNIISKSVSKLVSNPTAANIIGSMGSEGLEEFVQEYIGALNNKITLGQDTNIEDLVQDSLYSALIGAGSGGLITGIDAAQAKISTPNINNQQIQQKSVANETQAAPQTEEISEQVQASPDVVQPNVDNIQQTQTTAENMQSTAENKRIIGNRDFSSEKYKNLSDSDLEILNNLYDKYKNKAEMTDEEINQMQYLRKKINNVKNPELKTENTFEEVKKDLGKTKLDDYDSTMVDTAKEMVQANKQGKRTKQQWLDIAENIGLQAENMDSESLKKLALQSFKAERPNVKDNLNRQGKGFVDFKANEWVNAVYKGAGVGKRLQQPTQTTKNLQNISNTTKENIPEEKAKDNVIVAKNSSGKEIKLKQNKDTGIYTREDNFNRDLKDINQQFKNQTIAGKNGQKISNFYSNITEKSQFIDTDIRNMFKNENDIKFYNRVTNEESLNKANAEIGNTVQSQEKACNDFISKKEQFDATDMAKGWIFLSRFNEARDYDRAYLVAKQMREMGTKSGQAIQMLNLQSRLTPEGMYRWAVNELIQAENAFNSEKGRTKKEIEKYRDSFKLTPEETEFIKTQMEKVKNMEDGREKQIEIAKVNSMLSDKLPHKKGQSLKAWMRISMLLNPKTQVRNVVGNAIITPVNTIVDAVAGTADRLVARKTGQRTIGGPSIGGAVAYVKGTVKGLKGAGQDYKLGIDSRSANLDRFDIGQGKAFNENQSGPLKGLRNKVAKGLNATNDFLSFIMDAGDRAFYNGSVENSLYNQQKLNNTNEITKDMVDIAEMEGMQRTWNDNNDYTKAVLDLRRSINKIGEQMHIHVGEYGLGDLIIPFAKTPANLTKAIVDYSPVGFINTITEGKNLKNAIATGNYTPQMQHDFSQSLGKAVAGTLLYTLGIGLAKAGLTTGNSDDDKDLKNFMRYNLGIQPYSIKIGNKSFTYDWAQPIASPFAITADIEKGLNENMTPSQAIQHFLTSGFNILSEQSFLSGVNEVLNNNGGIFEGIEQQIVNMPATAIPTFLKQITDMLDGTKRQTYSKEGQVANMVKTAKSKDPKGTFDLAPQVDVLGNEIQKYGGDNNLFNVFINPANTEKGKTSPVAEEIYSLYDATQDKTIIPRKVDYSTKINGQSKILTTKEMESWQKASGKMVNEEVGKAIKDSNYKNLTTEQKADVINKIVNYSYQKAKSETFNTPLAKTYNGVEKARQKGIPIYDYYISKVKEK